jgi:hypothetical protein
MEVQGEGEKAVELIRSKFNLMLFGTCNGKPAKQNKSTAPKGGARAFTRGWIGG